jgi:hypothetical protein
LTSSSLATIILLDLSIMFVFPCAIAGGHTTTVAWTSERMACRKSTAEQVDLRSLTRSAA